MRTILTARHFKARNDIKEFALAEGERVGKFYDGLIKLEIILSFEKSSKSIKIAEVLATANAHHKFTATHSSEDFKISIESAIDKIIKQIVKFKGKRRTQKTPKRTSGSINRNTNIL